MENHSHTHCCSGAILPAQQVAFHDLDVRVATATGDNLMQPQEVAGRPDEATNSPTAVVEQCFDNATPDEASGSRDENGLVRGDYPLGLWRMEIHFAFLAMNARTCSATCWICGVVSSGNIGSETISCEAFTASGKSAGLCPRCL